MHEDLLMNQKVNIKVGAYPKNVKFHNTTNKSVLIAKYGCWLNGF